MTEPELLAASIVSNIAAIQKATHQQRVLPPTKEFVRDVNIQISRAKDMLPNVPASAWPSPFDVVAEARYLEIEAKLRLIYNIEYPPVWPLFPF